MKIIPRVQRDNETSDSVCAFWNQITISETREQKEKRIQRDLNISSFLKHEQRNSTRDHQYK